MPTLTPLHPNFKVHLDLGGRHSTEVAFTLPTQPARVRFPAFPNLTVDSAQGLIVIRTHPVLVREVLQKKTALPCARLKESDWFTLMGTLTHTGAVRMILETLVSPVRLQKQE